MCRPTSARKSSSEFGSADDGLCDLLLGGGALHLLAAPLAYLVPERLELSREQLAGDLFADREAADRSTRPRSRLRRQGVRKALDALPERERRILELRYGFEGEPWTLEVRIPLSSAPLCAPASDPGAHSHDPPVDHPGDVMVWGQFPCDSARERALDGRATLPLTPGCERFRGVAQDARIGRHAVVRAGAEARIRITGGASVPARYVRDLPSETAKAACDVSQQRSRAPQSSIVPSSSSGANGRLQTWTC